MAFEKVDKKNTKFNDVTESADGQVLLKRVYAEDGKTLRGVVTCNELAVAMAKQMTPAQRLRSGWEMYGADVDDYDDSQATYPSVVDYQAGLTEYVNELRLDDTLKDLPSMQGKLNAIANAENLTMLLKIRNDIDDISAEDEGLIQKATNVITKKGGVLL